MLVITNAGGFPMGVSANNILSVNSLPRSKRVSEVLEKTGLVERSGQGVDKMFGICISEGKPVPDYSATDDFQVCLKLRGTITNPALLLLIKEEQEKRVGDERLNAFDLLALYRVSRRESIDNIDAETQEKLFCQKLLINTKQGVALSPKYEEMKQRTGFTGDDTGDDTVNDTVNGNDALKLSSTEIAILAAIHANKDIIYSELMNRLSISRPTVARAISRLQKEGLLLRDGSDKTGSWIVTVEGLNKIANHG